MLLSDFTRAYEQASADVLRFLGHDQFEVIGEHNPGWKPGQLDYPAYVSTSRRRYVEALRLAPASLQRPCTVLDVGGFLGAFPLALSRCGHAVTLVENYDLYAGAFDPLRDFLLAEGVTIENVDFTEAGLDPPGEYDLVTAMAILEHLAHSPKRFLENCRQVLDPNGRLIVEVPNMAYWPRRAGLLRGRSPLPPIEHVYDAAVPFVGHHREYTLDDLVKVVRWSGLRVEATSTYNYTPLDGEPLARRLLFDVPRRLHPQLREVLMVSTSRVTPTGVSIADTAR